MEFIKTLSMRIPLFRNSRVLRYLAAGGMGAATNLATLYALTEFFHVWYLFSSIIAVSVSFIVSFILQKFWTFRSMDLDRVPVQLPMHLSLSFANLVLNTVLMYLLVDYIHLWYMLAQVIVAGVLAVANYTIYRLYIFKV